MNDNALEIPNVLEGILIQTGQKSLRVLGNKTTAVFSTEDLRYSGLGDTVFDATNQCALPMPDGRILATQQNSIVTFNPQAAPYDAPQVQHTLEEGQTFANSYMSLSQRYMFVTTVQGQTHVFMSDLATEAGKAKIPLAIRFRAGDVPAGSA